MIWPGLRLACACGHPAPIKHVNKTTLYGMAGEGNPVNSGETVAIKTHTLSGMTKKLGTIPEKCIILIRNPADSQYGQTGKKRILKRN